MELEVSSVHPVWIHFTVFASQRAGNTAKVYYSDLCLLCTFLGVEPGSRGGGEALASLTPTIAATYKRHLDLSPGRNRERVRSRALSLGGIDPKSPNTIARNLASVRRFYEYLIAHNIYLGKNPFLQDLIGKTQQCPAFKTIHKNIPADKVRLMLSLPDTRCREGLRDRTLLYLIFHAGLRSAEAAKLPVGAFFRTPKGTPAIKLKGKGSKWRTVALSENAAHAIISYAKQRIREGASDTDCLMRAYNTSAVNDGNGLSPKGISRIWGNYAYKAGVQKTSPHSGRKTAISKLLLDGHDHRHVQEFSGHSSVLMVERYDGNLIGVDENPGGQMSYED